MKEPIHQQSIEAEYKKTGIKPDDIELLREWVKTQPHLPAEHITELDLILTFNSCDRSTEVSKQVIDLNLTLRTHFTNLFKDRNVDELLVDVLKTLTFVKLDVPNENNYVHMYYRILAEGSKYDNVYVIRIVLMLLDIWQYEDGAWPGVVVLVDLADITVAHLAKMNMQAIQNVFYYVQEALYMNIKGIHFMNIPTLMDKIMFLIRPFMKKGILNILHFHQSGSDTISNFVPIEALPKDAGGQYKTIEHLQNETIDLLVANKQFFIEESKKRVNELLRPGKPKTLTDICGGVEGSFKQLNID